MHNIRADDFHHDVAFDLGGDFVGRLWIIDDCALWRRNAVGVEQVHRFDTEAVVVSFLGPLEDLLGALFVHVEGRGFFDRSLADVSVAREGVKAGDRTGGIEVVRDAGFSEHDICGFDPPTTHKRGDDRRLVGVGTFDDGLGESIILEDGRRCGDNDCSADVRVLEGDFQCRLKALDVGVTDHVDRVVDVGLVGEHVL